MAAATAEIPVYFGTYTGKGSEGIYHALFNEETGELGEGKLVARTESPTWLDFSPDGRMLYTTDSPGDEGCVSAYAIKQDGSGELELVNRQKTGGSRGCHLWLNRPGNWLMMANYRDGNVSVYPIKPDGSVGEIVTLVQHEGKSILDRQESPHPHCVILDPTEQYLLVPDLGIDKVMIYEFDARDGSLTAKEDHHADVEPGAGPRHLTFHHLVGEVWMAYLLCELDGNVYGYHWDEDKGVLEQRQVVSAKKEGARGAAAADIQIHPQGQLLYCSLRADNTLAAFTIDDADGRIAPAGHFPSGGQVPRGFRISPNGRFIISANQDSDDVAVFPVDGHTGYLGEAVSARKIPQAVCVQFLSPRTAA